MFTILIYDIYEGSKGLWMTYTFTVYSVIVFQYPLFIFIYDRVL